MQDRSDEIAFKYLEPTSCLLDGHAFTQEGDHWIDAAVRRMPGAKRVRVRYDSKEFFDLLARYPKMRRCFNGARKVALALDNTIYEVYE